MDYLKRITQDGSFKQYFNSLRNLFPIKVQILPCTRFRWMLLLYPLYCIDGVHIWSVQGPSKGILQMRKQCWYYFSPECLALPTKSIVFEGSFSCWRYFFVVFRKFFPFSGIKDGHSVSFNYLFIYFWSGNPNIWFIIGERIYVRSLKRHNLLPESRLHSSITFPSVGKSALTEFKAFNYRQSITFHYNALKAKLSCKH